MDVRNGLADNRNNQRDMGLTMDPVRAQRTLDRAAQARDRIPASAPRKYGWTVLWESLAEAALGLVVGAWLAASWSWDSVVFLAICAAILSWFAMRAEAVGRHVMPEGSLRLEHGVDLIHRVLLGMSCVVLVVALSVSGAGLPAAFGTMGRGLGWWAMLAGGLLAVGSLARIALAVVLIRGKDDHESRG